MLRFAVSLVAACAAASASELVLPNSQATTPGNFAVQVGATPSRFQQIVGSGQFTVPIVITGMRVRAAAGSGPVSFNHSSDKITLSTTPVYPNTNNGHTLPSTTFANNIGPDATVVYNGPFSVSSPGCAGPAACPFDMGFTFTTPFPYDPNKGRLLIDIVSTPAGAPNGSLDGVMFSDSTASTVANVSGDPTAASGTLSLFGLVLELDTASSGAALSGSFGYLLSASSANPSQTTGVALLGVLNLDGAGNLTGTYTFQTGATDPKGARTLSGTLTGSYSTNSNGSGTMMLNPDSGGSLALAFVITDGGQAAQLVVTSSPGPGVDLSNGVLSGVARGAVPGPLQGTFGFALNNNPMPAGTIGVLSFDGAGGATVSFTSAGPGGQTMQPQVSTGNLTGSYSVNSDGSGALNLGSNGTFAFVITDSGNGLLMLLTNGTNNNVSSGVARAQ